ncbi:MAG: hypothetical protein GC172_06275 [Phycisphaera sp.]|nr:hypothetical protein [Phycisphaera sp.]
MDEARDAATAATDGAFDAAAAARARRFWRIALIVYLVPVTVVTHWPRLGFAGSGAVDKFAHFLGFGVIAWLALHARPFGRASLGFLFAVAWVYIDEVTQAIPILGRTFSGYDMIAGWVGVALAGAIYLARAARRPRGVLDARDPLESIVYSDSRNWTFAAGFILAATLVIGGAIVAWRAQGGVEPSFGSVIHPLAMGFLCGLVGATLLVEGRVLARRALAIDGLSAREIPHRGVRSRLVGPIALLAAIPLAWALHWLLVRALFGAEPSADHAIDQEGFMVMRPAFMLVAAACMFEFLRTALVRRARAAA